jgi:hypothetical protein
MMMMMTYLISKDEVKRFSWVDEFELHKMYDVTKCKKSHTQKHTHTDPYWEEGVKNNMFMYYWNVFRNENQLTVNL